MSQCRKVAGLVHDIGGSLSTVIAIMLPFLLLAVGGAVDYLRLGDARSRTWVALDSAVLAGARKLQADPDDSEGALASAAAFYALNIARREQVEEHNITFQITPERDGVTAQGSSTLKTQFLKIVGIDELPIMPTPAAKFPIARISSNNFGNSNIEISVMLDVTGSMCDDGSGPCTSSLKLDGLKLAVADLINGVIKADQSQYSTRMALVPFSTLVRVGPDGGGAALMKQLTNLDEIWSGYYKQGTNCVGATTGSEEVGNGSCTGFQAVYLSGQRLNPCVTDRYTSTDGFDLTENPPGPNKWFNAHSGSRTTLSLGSDDTPLVVGLGLTADDPADQYNYSQDGSCQESGNGNIIVPLTSDKSALLASVNGLSATGGTAGMLGTAFTWYMLSPKWDGIWTGAATPAPYSDITTLQADGTPKLRKIAVLMTDGLYNTWRSWKGQNPVTATTNAKTLCDGMKAQGIEIYTVGFALNELAGPDYALAVDVLKSCGTDIKHFYDTLTVTELRTAFQSIGQQITTLRLVQ